MTYKVGIYDASTGQEIIRDMTDDEIADRNQEILLVEATKKAEEIAKAEVEMKRQAALAKLEALGLEPADLKALGF